MEREVNETWWRVEEAVPAEDGGRMWTVALVKCTGHWHGEPDAEAIDYADLYTASAKRAGAIARKLNKRDGLKGEG